MTRLARLLATGGLVVALGCALAALVAGLGYRFGWWHYRAGILTLAVVFWTAATAAVACAIAAILAARRADLRRPLVLGLFGLVISGVTAWVPYDLRAAASRLPPIHDITTDLADPPKFVRAASLRGPDDHPVAYGGPAIGDQQKKGYADIAPLVLKAPREKVFAAAQAALTAMGLELTDADAAQGHIEATATSLVFGFKDDVVVRIADAPGGTKVDVRSMSRVGRSDLGMNAKRIREFQARLKLAAR